MVSVAASRYARALADVTFDPHSGLDPHRVTEQLGTVAALVKGSTELQRVLRSRKFRKRSNLSRTNVWGWFGRM